MPSIFVVSPLPSAKAPKLMDTVLSVSAIAPSLVQSQRNVDLGATDGDLILVCCRRWRGGGTVACRIAHLVVAVFGRDCGCYYVLLGADWARDGINFD